MDPMGNWWIFHCHCGDTGGFFLNSYMDPVGTDISFPQLIAYGKSPFPIFF